jgi:hypothetical protein
VAQFNVGPRRLKLSPVKLTPVHSAVGIITISNRTVSPLAGLFMKCTREWVASDSQAVTARQLSNLRR